MITLKRLFAGNYRCVENTDIFIQSMAQHTSEYDVDEYGNRWVSTVCGTDECTRHKTKKEAVEYVEQYVLPRYPVAKIL